MYSVYDDPAWVEERIRERDERNKQKRLNSRRPGTISIDARGFTDPLSRLATTVTLKIEREGSRLLPGSPITIDISVILCQLTQTFNLIRFINGEQTRFENYAYRQQYSFVILPLIRTMIDGLYNCTSLLDDPSRGLSFRVSGYYRMREGLRADEEKYSTDPRWTEHLANARTHLELGMRADNVTNADLDNAKNKWPLLGEYLGRKPDTPHKKFLRELTLGFWKEYSSVSHASYDGLVNIFPFIAPERIPHEMREGAADAAERNIAMHIGRAAGLLLCLLTEIQHYFGFENADVDQRLGEIWAAILPVIEVRELYDLRYKSLLRRPPAERGK